MSLRDLLGYSAALILSLSLGPTLLGCGETANGPDPDSPPPAKDPSLQNPADDSKPPITDDSTDSDQAEVTAPIDDEDVEEVTP